ncbi:MAG: hypothetical protein AAFV95_06180 [Bacteroidota bacterium]
MKKTKIQTKLDLDKMMVGKLGASEVDEVLGGKGFLSIGKKCTTFNGGCGKHPSRGIWCSS